MIFTINGTVTTTAGLTITNPVIEVELVMKRDDIVVDIRAYASETEYNEGAEEVHLRQAGSRDRFRQLRLKAEELKSIMAGETIYDMVKREVEVSLQSKLNVSIDRLLTDTTRFTR